MTYLDKKNLLLLNLILGFFAWSDISKLQAPEGFKIQEFVSEIDDARQMVEGNNYIFVGTKSAGNVYAIDKINSNKISKNLKQILSNTSLLRELQKKSWNNFTFDSKNI